MSSSPLGTVELYAVADFADNHPVGARAWRDGPINNALHYADQRAQVLVNWQEVTSGTEGQTNAAPPGGQSTSSWSEIDRAPFSASLKTDGTPYRLRIQLAGYSQGGAAVDFRLIVSDFDSIDDYVFSPPTYAETYTGITSTSTAILTPDSGLNYIDVGIQAADPALRIHSTLDDLAGTYQTVSVCELWVSVWSRYTVSTDKAILTGLHVSEYFAP